ncbi:hypothetical protein GGX14DRAFT_540975 [Mycena pura]|uniref:HNH nuclease domain-containing protein n=1 Tax=Mycena pura TaxID=153505 RepID=A0AAD6VQR7_9AGAR|nr:hypothetical protein GGX14DRAFT_540975 [Mycena pura]
MLPATTPCPQKNSSGQFNTCGTVLICHPKLPEGPPFLSFDAFASKPDGDVLGGVPLGFVFDVCYVVAGNKNGQLNFAAQPKERFADYSDLDRLLAPGDYIFVVIQEGGLDYDYVLCPSFAAWTPPEYIPDRWLGNVAGYEPPFPPLFTDVSSAVRADDMTCIVTGSFTSVQASHMMPKGEAKWVNSHIQILKLYGGVKPVEELNSWRNEVLLRADLNIQGLDQALFFFVPYKDSIVTLFPNRMAPDLASDYHMRTIRFPPRVRRGYLFVRFAWNIYKLWGSELQNTITAMAMEDDESLKRTDGRRKKRRTDNPGGGSGSDGGPGGGSRGDGGPGGGSRGDGGPSSSRTSRKSKKNSGGGGRKQNVEGVEDAGALETDDEAQLSLYELVDAVVSKRPYLTLDDVEAGRYPGFSKIKRLELEYRRAHPQISAVGVSLSSPESRISSSSTTWRSPVGGGS